MPTLAGTRTLKTWRGSYSFAIDAGAIGTIVLRSSDGQIPAGSVIMGGFLNVTGAFTTGTAATGAVQVEAANDIVSATVVSGAPYSTTGRKSIVPVFTGATSVATTVDRSPSFVIATGTVTAGIMDVVLFYL